jgi:hypothetical protein
MPHFTPVPVHPWSKAERGYRHCEHSEFVDALTSNAYDKVYSQPMCSKQVRGAK